MRLSRKRAIELCIELWTWLAETGKFKKDWPGWKKYTALHYCWFCEYSEQKADNLCDECPLGGDYMECNNLYFCKWKMAKTDKDRKKYAGLFLEQIRTLEKK